MNEENKNIYVSYWLLLITFLVALMIVIGGLTRLTDSGLSITNWGLISGILPPYSLNEWEKLFTLYKQIPEYKLINSSMTLDEFKVIFWWEYAHRLLGRLIGLLYFIPLLYFTFKKIFLRKFLTSLYIVLVLIVIQGFVGWYMVKSGLTDRTDVSHYRLALHLTLAFIIFIMLFWNYLNYTNKKKIVFEKKFPSYVLKFFIFCIILQISIGALVSGLDAGQVYNSWPLMNQSYFPNDSNFNELFSLNLFETPSLLQFIHRNIAYFILVFFLIVTTIVFKNSNFVYLRKSVIFVFISLTIQILLGILTIISGAQIILSSMHQIGSIILIIASIILVFQNSRIN